MSVLSLSLPRCYSTALLLSVTNAKSFDICLHEPTVRPYCENKFKDITKGWFVDGFPTYQDYDNFLKNYYSKSIFIKDMVFSSKDWVKENISKYNFIILLWIRDPYAALMSVYNKLNGDDPNPRLRDTSSYRDMYNLYLYLKQNNIKIYILDMDNLIINPSQYLLNISKLLNIKNFGSTNWDKLDCNQLKQWKESKTMDQIKHWHGDAVDSTGFIAAKVKIVDFKDVKAKDMDYIKQLYEENLYYYSLLNKDKILF